MNLKTICAVGPQRMQKKDLEIILQLAELFKSDWFLRTSGGEGYESVFEFAYRDVENKQLIIPWPKFNGLKYGVEIHKLKHFEKALNLIRTTHPTPKKIITTKVMVKLAICNPYKVLGEDLNSPADLLLIWSEDDLLGGANICSRIAYHWNTKNEKKIRIENLFKIKHENPNLFNNPSDLFCFLTQN
jgi:hypothetical protein